MRRITFAEGRGSVEVNKGRAKVRLDGQYVGRATRLGDGTWRDPARPHLLHDSPADVAESMTEPVAA